MVSEERLDCGSVHDDFAWRKVGDGAFERSVLKQENDRVLNVERWLCVGNMNDHFWGENLSI